MHLVIDSKGLKLSLQGVWDAQKHGRSLRSWRKAAHAGTSKIVASTLTNNAGDDAGEVPALLEQVEGEIASLAAAGRMMANLSTKPSRAISPVFHPRSLSLRVRQRSWARKTPMSRVDPTGTFKSLPTSHCREGRMACQRQPPAANAQSQRRQCIQGDHRS